MKATMIAAVRTQAGLGKPPTRYSTNRNEAMNNTIKKSLSYKEKYIAEFCKHMKDLIKQQFEEVEKAIRGIGEYTFAPGFEHPYLQEREWNDLNLEQRKEHIKK